MASIQKTKLGYRAQILFQGKRISKSFRTQREARVWAETHLTELRAEAGKAPAEKFTLAEAMDRYEKEVSPKKRGYRWEVIRLKAMREDPHFPSGQLMCNLTTAHFAEWRDIRLKQVQAGSVLREISQISALLEVAKAEWHWIQSNPIRELAKPRMPDHREVVIAAADVRKMLEAMGYSPRKPIRTVAQSVACCFLVALRTGMRAGELCGLTWDQVFEDYCHLPVTKTKKRNVPLTRKALRIINKMAAYDPTLVFGLNSRSLDANFRKYRERAGLSGFTFHDARHTAATMLSRKLDVMDLCKMFGWSTTKHALIYYNPTASSIADILNR